MQSLPRNAHGYPAVTFTDVAQELSTRPSMDKLMPHENGFDVVVIGGGYTGLSAALHVKQAHPDWRVLLLEAGQIGSAASGKSGGHVCGGFQARDAEIDRYHGRALGDKLRQAAEAGPALVRRLIAQYKMDCDVRDGYVSVNGGGQSHVSRDGDFGIDPYPFVLGMAQAARQIGVRIVEHARVTSLTDQPSCRMMRLAGREQAIEAQYVVAAGGHAMGRDLALLREATLNKTVEISITTVKTEPLPPALLALIMPETATERLPGADNKRNVEYWSVDRAGRLIFGSRVESGRHDPARLARMVKQDMLNRFPCLAPGFREMRGRDLVVSPLVEGETLCFTRDLMPNVGTVGDSEKIIYVNGLGGLGIALGTLLGKEAAHKITALAEGRHEKGVVFDLFASMKHGWTPASPPLRRLASKAGVGYLNACRLIDGLQGR